MEETKNMKSMDKVVPHFIKEVVSVSPLKFFRVFDTKNIFFLKNNNGSLSKEGGQNNYIKKYDYFMRRYNLRCQEIEQLIWNYNLYNKNCLSICSGFGMDEILLYQKGNISVDCIENDFDAMLFHMEMMKQFHVGNQQVFNMDMNSFFSEKKYDMVFTSSPGNWMNEPMLIGIPDYFLVFVDRYLRFGGYFVARLYGGNFTDFLMKNFFISLLKKRLSSVGLMMLEYKYNSDICVSLFIAKKEKVNHL
jgi:hypothetical protein